MAQPALKEEEDKVTDVTPFQRKTSEATPAPAQEQQPAPAAERPQQQPQTQAPPQPKAAEPKKSNGRRRLIILGVAIVALAAGAYYGHDWWTVGRFMVSTDDAYVGADTSTIAPRVAGYVVKVAATNNSSVKAGDPLVYLDDRDQKLAVAAAENQVATQKAALDRYDKQIDAAQASVTQAQANIASYQAAAELAATNLNRSKQLVSTQTASQQTLDQAKATNDQAVAAVESAKAGLTSAEANVEVLRAERVEAQRVLDQNQTALDQQKLTLEHYVITAPYDGVIGNRAVDPGEYVSVGQRLLALVPLTAVYVDANFKETQIGDIRPGAKATVTVDAYPDQPIEATVESVAPASGSTFSLLPTDNATGNFTKITQRVTVRIKIPAEEAAKGLLRPGLSVEAEIDSRTGNGQVATN